MKFLGVLALTVIIASISVKAETINHEGQPGCKTDEELTIKLHRNNWDPTAYWVCSVKNEPAKKARCPDATLFFDPEKQCIEAMEWYWTEPKEPLSKP